MRRTKADLEAMVAAAEECIRRWNVSTNPVLHVAAGQLRQAMGSAEADSVYGRMQS